MRRTPSKFKRYPAASNRVTVPVVDSRSDGATNTSTTHCEPTKHEPMFDGDDGSIHGGAFELHTFQEPCSAELLELVRSTAIQLMKKIGGLPSSQTQYFANDSHVSRFIMSAGVRNDKQAAKDLVATIQWRVARGLLDTSRPEQDHIKNSFFPIGLDRRKHVVIYSNHARACLPTNQNAEPTFDHAFQVLESACDDTRGIQRVLWVIDFNGFTFKHICKKHITLGCNWFGAHNPERLGALVLLNPPRIFMALWSFIHMFLDPNSAERLLVCRNAGEAQAYLDKYCMNPATAAWIVAASNLPPTDGGNYPAGTDFSLLEETKWRGPPTRDTLLTPCAAAASPPPSAAATPSKTLQPPSSPPLARGGGNSSSRGAAAAAAAAAADVHGENNEDDDDDDDMLIGQWDNRGGGGGEGSPMKSQQTRDLSLGSSRASGMGGANAKESIVDDDSDGGGDYGVSSDEERADEDSRAAAAAAVSRSFSSRATSSSRASALKSSSTRSKNINGGSNEISNKLSSSSSGSGNDSSKEHKARGGLLKRRGQRHRSPSSESTSTSSSSQDPSAQAEEGAWSQPRRWTTRRRIHVVVAVVALSFGVVVF